MLVLTVVGSLDELLAPTGKVRGSSTILGEVTYVDCRVGERSSAGKKGKAAQCSAGS